MIPTDNRSVIRPAEPNDLVQIQEFDYVMHESDARKDAAVEAIGEGRALVIETHGAVVGYGIIHHQFFARSFIDLVYIAEDERNRGLGPRLLEALEGLAKSLQVFTSTNESNVHMQHVLEAEGYRRVGRIEELDPGDPELVYVRNVKAV